MSSFPSLAVDSLASCMKSLPFSVFSVHTSEQHVLLPKVFGG